MSVEIVDPVEEEPEDEEPRRRWRGLILIVVFLVLISGGLAYWRYRDTHRPAEIAIPSAATADGGQLVGGGGPVVVEIYVDFLCPACKELETNVSPMLTKYIQQNRIRVVWHPVTYHNGASTPVGYSERAASAVACAGDAGKAAPYGNALLTALPAGGGPGLSDDQLIELAGNVGIITPVFAQCVRAKKYAPWVNQGTQAAVKRGVTLVPTMFVNGLMLPKPSPPAIESAIVAAR